jgi:hypothetical protein
MSTDTVLLGKHYCEFGKKLDPSEILNTRYGDAIRQEVHGAVANVFTKLMIRSRNYKVRATRDTRAYTS